MERVIIRHPNGETLPLYGRGNVVEISSGQQKKKLLGENIVEMTVRSARPITFYIGDKITVFGEDYFLNLLPEAKKEGGKYEYSLTFESVQYDLAKVVFLDEDKSGLSTSTNFTLRANIEEIAEIIINNLNRVYGAGKWILAKTPDQTTDVRDFSYAEDNCLAVLQKACEEYGTEFKIEQEGSGDNVVYKLSICKVGSVIPYTFKYGHNKGLYSVKRKTINSGNIITRLYAYGGTQNIPSDYRNYSARLRFSDEAYIEDDEAIKAYGLIEGAKLFEEIFPKYSGEVTAVGEDPHVFTDSALDFDLNEKDAKGNTKYLIDGISAKITFNSGALAGYTFEVKEGGYDHSTKTFTIIKYEDERGFVFPSVDNTTFRIAVGDKYILSDIKPPQSYIDAAEEELRTAARQYLDDNKAPRVQYSVDIAEEYLKKISGSGATVNIFNVGDYLGLVDTEIGVDRTGEASIRLTQFSRSLVSKTAYNYSLDLSDTVEVSLIERIVSDQKDLESVVVLNQLTDVSRLRRSWRTTQELLNMVFDPDGYFDTGNIKPLSIETSMLAVGAKSGQFTLRNTVIAPNYEGNANKVNVTGGQLLHYGMEISELPEALKKVMSGTSPAWNVSSRLSTLSGSGSFYIYARCSKATATAEIIFDANQKTVEDGSYYYFLIGVLHSTDTDTNTRWISLTYGSSTINGRFIKTGRISSADGSCYFDLDNNTIHGRITFTADDGSVKNILDLDAQSTEAYNYISNTLPGLLEGIYSQLDGVIETWFGEEAPTLSNAPAKDWSSNTEKDNHLGDIYYDTVSGYGYRFSKTGSTYSWSQMSDSGVAAALEAAAKAQDTADGKRRIFVSTPYPPYDKGDLWVKGGVSGSDIMYCKTSRASGVYVSSDWDKASDYTNDENLQVFIDGVFADLVAQVDGKIENWYQSTNPATNWTTTADKNSHAGDMWYNTSTKELSRWNGSSWDRITDKAALDAADAASKAQDTADGKRTVFTSTPYTPYYVGDLWVNGTDIKVCNKQRLTGSYVASDWGLASNYDHTKTVIDGGLVTAGSIQLVGDNNVVQAGISGKGTDGSSVRIWAGATMSARGTAPFRVNQNGEVFARYRIELQDTNNSGLAGICGQGTDGTDTGIRFWAGSTYANRATAPFRVKKDGSMYCTKAELANGCKIGEWEVFNNGIFNDSGLAYLIARKSYGDGRYTEARIGTSVFPASSGIVGAGYFENTMLNTYGTNYGVYINVNNAANNLAIKAIGDVAVKGLCVSYELDTLTTVASTYHLLGYTGQVLFVTCKTKTSWLVLPDRYSVANHLGISSTEKFSVPFKIIISADSTQTCRLWGRYSGNTTLNNAKYPYRVDANGANQTSGLDMAKGDSIYYQLVFDGTNYKAYRICYTN